MKFRMYIDEVGNPDLASSDNPVHRFLSLTGIVIETRLVEQVIHPELEALKSKYFGSHPDDPVILHRKEIVNARPPFECLQRAELRTEFDRDILEALDRWNFTVISACLDKKHHRDTYTTWRYDPYHYCLALLLERFCFFLKQRRAVGDVFAESRGGKEDLRLKKSFEWLYSHGTEYISADLFRSVLTSRQLKVKPKANNVAGLQIADLVAHPSRCEILQEVGLLGRPVGDFAAKVILLLQRKYYQREGVIAGYGKKFL